MCGIVGIFARDPAARIDSATISRMCDTIVHRGPDDEGQLVDGPLGMGMRRLSIVDLGGGHQPIANEDGTVHVVYNGEIFNFPELRAELESLGHVFRTRSDTEILVHGYEAWGDELPEHLNGMFAFSIWDSRRRRVLLARDHVGIKPLYVYDDGRQVAWASEVKALLALPGARAAVDPAGLVDFLSLGYVPAPRTIFAGIRKLPPATRLVIDSQGTRESGYWQLGFPHDVRDEGAWCDELRGLIDDAVRRQLMSDVPLGAFLSGGVDSSTIVATMQRLGVERISTYSIGFGGADAFHSELALAAETARQFGTDHHEIVVEPNVAELIFPLVRHLDEPVTDTSFLVTYLVSKLARETVTVILSGVGGDEIFAGYRRYLGPRLQRLYQLIPSPLDRGLIRPLVGRLPVDRGSAGKALVRYARGFLEQLDAPEAERYQSYVGIFRGPLLAELFTPAWAETLADHQARQVAEYYEQAPSQDPLDRMMYADLKTALVDSLLAFTDKMSMAVSLEARVPLLDYRLIELAARIPARHRLRGTRGLKHIFRQAMSDRLPRATLYRKKRGFGTPISRWMRGSLRPLVADLLSPDRLIARGYFRPDAVWRLIDEHQAERADYSEHILALLMFEVWQQVFLDGGAFPLPGERAR